MGTVLEVGARLEISYAAHTHRLCLHKTADGIPHPDLGVVADLQLHEYFAATCLPRRPQNHTVRLTYRM